MIRAALLATLALRGLDALERKLLGPAIAPGELWAMPRAGAAPPPRKWKRGEVPLLFAHVTAFALAVELL
jgi:hypothetical protein